MRFRLLLAGLLGGAIATAPALAQDDHEIRLVRPAKVGERYRIDSIGTQRREAILRRDGTEVRRIGEGIKVELTGEAETLLADEKGNALAVAVKVLSLVNVDGLRRDEMIPPATKLVERRVGARQIFEIDGKAIDGPLKDALEAVLSETNDPRAPSDDELMGTKEKKKVGERWPVNREALASFLSADAELGMNIKPDGVSGEGVLKALERCGDAQCMRVEVAATLAAAPREGKAVPGSPREAKIDLTLSTLLPLDVTQGAYAESSRIRMVFDSEVPDRDGRALAGQSVWEQSTERKLTPLR